MQILLLGLFRTREQELLLSLQIFAHSTGEIAFAACG